MNQTIAKDVIAARKELRKELLIELYESYFSNNSRIKTLSLSDISNSEKHLAYEYLKGKGLITINKVGRDSLEMKITVTGIDIVENY